MKEKNAPEASVLVLTQQLVEVGGCCDQKRQHTGVDRRIAAVKVPSLHMFVANFSKISHAADVVGPACLFCFCVFFSSANLKEKKSLVNSI